ncbi:MAG: hypothetical protein M3P04_14630, partial [Actinomycetota bacterium]|nr:hypothetical protein [Actinomycetota bacterium]
MKKALGALALVVLAAGAAGAWYLTRSHTTRSDSPSYPKDWDARVTDLVRFVETERGLTFKHPVAVEFMQDSDFEARVKTPKAEAAKDRAEFERFAGELRALGLLEGKPDLLDAQNELVSKSLAGLYVAKEKTLFVRGITTTPFVRSILAHELTHALQDQHFDIDALRKRAPAGAGVATTALIEGDAVRVQEAYARQLSDGDKATFAKEELAAKRLAQSTRDVPQVMQDLLRFPYAFGPTYVDALTTHGGTSGIDAAFRSPPVSEAQVLDPRGYQLGYKPQAVTDPALPTGAKALDKPAAFGQFSLFEVLGVQLGRTRAWAAVTGWSGDRYVSYQLRRRTCLAITVRMSDQPRAKALEAAFREW